MWLWLFNVHESSLVSHTSLLFHLLLMLSPCHGCYALTLVLLFSSFRSYFFVAFSVCIFFVFFILLKWNHISWESRIKQTTVWQKSRSRRKIEMKEMPNELLRSSFRLFMCSMSKSLIFKFFFQSKAFCTQLLSCKCCSISIIHVYINIFIYSKCVIDNNIRYRCLFPSLSSLLPSPRISIFFSSYFFIPFSAFYFTLFFRSFAYSFFLKSAHRISTHK